MPDAEPEMTVEQRDASMSGCAGQRCMAASVMLAVGGTTPGFIVHGVVKHRAPS